MSRDIQYYNLDMIISVGYRVHSLRGVQFRMWATRTLKEYLIKGFAMNDELQAKEHKPMYMSDWIQRLDDFLKLSGKELLQHAGTISAKLAKEKADAEYNKFEERTRNELSPVELHFIENFERERQKLVSGSSHPALPDEQS